VSTLASAAPPVRPRRSRASPLARRERLFAYALLAPAIVAVAGLIAWPMYLIVSISFREGKSLNFLALGQRPLGLGNYRIVLADPATWHSVGVSLVYTFGTLVPAFAIGLGTALLLNRSFPLRRWLRSVMLLPWAVPGVMVSIVFLWMFDASFGVVNALLRATGLVTTVAGKAGVTGSDDLTGLAATFKSPSNVTYDGQGNLYVADTGNHTVRQIVLSTGKVNTIAGTAGMAGTGDGAGAAARFAGPMSVVSDGAGRLYVTDGNTLRQIAVSSGSVTTIAGTPGRMGVRLGDVSTATLSFPVGLTMLPNGTIAFVEPYENAVLILK